MVYLQEKSFPKDKLHSLSVQLKGIILDFIMNYQLHIKLLQNYKEENY